VTDADADRVARAAGAVDATPAVVAAAVPATDAAADAVEAQDASADATGSFGGRVSRPSLVRPETR